MVAPPTSVLLVWGLAALLLLIVIAIILRAERRGYVRIGRQGGWLAVRLFTLPIAVLAAAVTIFAARQVNGMEALAVFYGMLFTATPLLFFGLHVLVARLSGLTSGQGMGLAAVGLGILLLPAFIAVPLQQIGWQAQYAWSSFESGRAADSRAWHTLAGAQRIALPDGQEVWSQHWRAEPGLKSVEEIEVPPYKSGGGVSGQPFMTLGSWICRDREDLHVTWPAVLGEAVMTVRWRDTSGTLHRSQLRIARPTGEPVPIAAQWGPQEVTLPLRPPRTAAWTAMPQADGKVEYFRSLNMWEPHESPQDACLPRPYRAGYPFIGIALRIERGGGAEPLWARMPRPAD